MTTNPDDKKPKQVLATYAVIALIVMFLLNIFVLPGIMERSIRETTYSDFLKGIDSKQIQEVQFDVQDSIIYYTLKQDGKTQVCKTGLINTDSELIDKITSSGADLTSEIPTQQSPLMNMLIGFILPTIIFIFLGQLLFKKITNSMTRLMAYMTSVFAFFAQSTNSCRPNVFGSVVFHARSRRRGRCSFGPMESSQRKPETKLPPG